MTPGTNEALFTEMIARSTVDERPAIVDAYDHLVAANFAAFGAVRGKAGAGMVRAHYGTPLVFEGMKSLSGAADARAMLVYNVGPQSRLTDAQRSALQEVIDRYDDAQRTSSTDSASSGPAAVLAATARGLSSAAARDDDVRASCFASLDVLCAKHGPEVPYKDGLDAGFAFRGRRVPFLNYQKGIYRAAAQSGPAALSVNTSFKSPYDDAETTDGFSYAYRAGSIDQPDNRALREAFRLQAPLVYFVGTRPGYYRPEWPVFVTADDPDARMVTLTPGRMIGSYDEREPFLPEDPIERRYAVRETRVRLHQSRFRARVLPAYSNQCTICRLKETRLLDAAHIVADSEVAGEPSVSNGLSLCSIHHRAFDEDLVGVSPDYEVRVHPRLLDDEDGPMLELLKGSHGKAIVLPRSTRQRPDRELLAVRFDRFVAA